MSGERDDRIPSWDWWVSLLIVGVLAVAALVLLNWRWLGLAGK